MAKDVEAARLKAEEEQHQACIAAAKQREEVDEQRRLAEQEREAAEIRAQNAMNALATQNLGRVEHDLSHVELSMVPSAWLHRRSSSTISSNDAVVVAVDVLDQLVKMTLERCKIIDEGYCIVSAQNSTPSSK